jgi:hypothetical protein
LARIADAMGQDRIRQHAATRMPAEPQEAGHE